MGERKPPRHIETVISNVFVFGDLVYKLYKNDNDFFNKGFRDISSKSARFDFTKRDFEWNHSLSPSIYLELKGIKVINGHIDFCEPTDKAEELVMVMKRFDTKDVLFEKLMRGEISKDESYAMGKQLAETLKRVHTHKIKGKSFYHTVGGRINDLRAWIKSVAEYIDEAESKEYCDFLDIFRDKNRELFEGKLSDALRHGGDAHSHNAVFTNGALCLIDAFPPKEEWLVEHELTPLYRIGTDIWVLTDNRDLFDAFINGYEDGSGTKIDHELDSFFVIYAAAIMVSYLYMLSRTDAGKKEAARRFHKFIKKYYKATAKKF